MFEFHLNQEHLTGDIPEAFNKWVMYTDGARRENNVSGNVLAGWGVAVFVSRNGVEHDYMRLYGPVVLNSQYCNCIGVHRATNNTGELSAMIEALSG